MTMLWQRLARAPWRLPVDAPVHQRLREEWERLTPAQRRSARRKQWQRELLMVATGQSRLLVDRVPAGLRRVLWLYTWTTIGDSIMDLAPRTWLPASITLDLSIAEPLAALHRGDKRWRRVFCDPEHAQGDYELVLLQDLSTPALALARRLAPRARIATLLGHVRGEQFDRVGFAQRRLEQLFGLPAAPLAPPTLDLGERAPRDPAKLRIAVALGGRDPRRTYRRWADVAETLLGIWPADAPALEFVLLGNRAAADDAAAFARPSLAGRCRDAVGRFELAATARLIRDCDAFLGADGGLMHIAVTQQLPGLALFVEIDPAFRLVPGTTLQSLYVPKRIDDVAPREIAARLLLALRGSSAGV